MTARDTRERYKRSALRVVNVNQWQEIGEHIPDRGPHGLPVNVLRPTFYALQNRMVHADPFLPFGPCIATLFDDVEVREPSDATHRKLQPNTDMRSHTPIVVSASTPRQNASAIAPKVANQRSGDRQACTPNSAFCANRLCKEGRQAGRSSMGAGHPALPGWTCPPPPLRVPAAQHLLLPAPKREVTNT